MTNRKTKTFMAEIGSEKQKPEEQHKFGTV